MRTEIIEEEIPVGKAITTKYFDDAGELVRQDVHIQVKEGIFFGAEANLVEKK